MGTLLAERGGNVPIILDDTVVYCDDDRINLMFDALSRAGKHQQIMAFTCRLRSFAPLGGHTLRKGPTRERCSANRCHSGVRGTAGIAGAPHRHACGNAPGRCLAHDPATRRRAQHVGPVHVASGCCSGRSRPA